MRATTFIAISAAAALTLSTSTLIAGAGAASSPLSIAAATVTVEGTSNVHDWTASTSAVVLTAVETATSEGDVLEEALQPGALKAFEVRIPAKGLTSPKEGIDKNMHKALKVEAHPHITFKLRTLEPAGAAYRATGMLTIAGVEKEVVLDLQVTRTKGALAVTGATNLLMTDFGVKPPTAMLGMVKASPKITVRIEAMVTAN
jgi:polyisoprenoid-binding protein YceI